MYDIEIKWSKQCKNPKSKKVTHLRVNNICCWSWGRIAQSVYWLDHHGLDILKIVVRFPAGVRLVHLSGAHPAYKSTWVVFSPGVKRPGRVIDNSPSRSTETNKQQNYTSIPCPSPPPAESHPTICLYGEHRNGATVTLTCYRSFPKTYAIASHRRTQYPATD